MADTERLTQEPLLTEWLAARFGFDYLADRLPGEIAAQYLYLLTFLIIDVGLVNTYIHFYTDKGHVFVDQPYVIVAPLGLMLAAFGIRYFVNAYDDILTSLPVTTDGTAADHFDQLVSLRTKLILYAFSALAMYLLVFVNVGINNIIAAEGTASLINYLVVWQVGYLPFILEFGVLYFALHVLLPRRIMKADVSMFFYATRNMGGFAPLGQLLKYSYYLFTVGLLLYFVLVYGPVLFSFDEVIPATPGVIEAVLFSVAWVLGVFSIVYSMVTIHRVMASEKDQRIDELEAEMEEVIENPYDINNSSVDMETLEDIRQRRQEIRDTRVYPASFTMWSQIFISILLPQAMNLAIQAIS